MADDSVAEGEKSRWLQPAKDQSSAAIIQLDAIHTSEEKPGERERERERRWVRSLKILCIPVVIVHQTPSVSLCPLLSWYIRVLVIAPSREQARVSRLSADCGWSIISKSPVPPPPSHQFASRHALRRQTIARSLLLLRPRLEQPQAPRRARSASSTMPAKSRKVTTLTEGTTWLAGNRAVVRRGQT